MNSTYVKKTIPHMVSATNFNVTLKYTDPSSGKGMNSTQNCPVSANKSTANEIVAACNALSTN